MPNNTYVALDTRTISSATSSVVFDPIPQTYTDLVLIVRGVPSTNTAGQRIRINGSSSSIYSSTLINGDTGARSGRYSNSNAFDAMNYQQALSAHYNSITHFFDYTNNATNKSTLTRYNGATTETSTSVNLWRNTAPITAIEILMVNGNFASGSVVSLYGIRREGVSPAPKATGGAIYDDETYYYHAFGASGTFTPTQSITTDILVVAGGGAGGGSQGAGGGAGGLLGFSSQSLSAQSYSVTIGAGGTGVSASYNGGPGNNGSNSTFQGLTAAVGGGGGSSSGNSANGVGSGGSGGGRANTSGAGTGTTGQGNAGGTTGTAGAKGGGGASAVGGLGLAGGAAGGTGATFNSTVGGTAGPYAFINAMGAATGAGELSGGNYYFAGGGAGGCDVELGGLGGGGISTIAGRANTGGGGGGACGNPGAGGNGGSGIIIVRYLKA